MTPKEQALSDHKTSERILNAPLSYSVAEKVVYYIELNRLADAEEDRELEELRANV